jgi:hypothetical protein
MSDGFGRNTMGASLIQTLARRHRVISGVRFWRAARSATVSHSFLDPSQHAYDLCPDQNETRIFPYLLPDKLQLCRVKQYYFLLFFLDEFVSARHYKAGPSPRLTTLSRNPLGNPQNLGAKDRLRPKLPRTDASDRYCPLAAAFPHN